jgi:hypothetical protein
VACSTPGFITPAFSGTDHRACMASVRYTLRLSPRSPSGDDALASRTWASLISEALGARREPSVGARVALNRSRDCRCRLPTYRHRESWS